MTTTKITYNSAINAAIRVLNGEKIDNAFEVAEKLVALGQQLEKRNSAKSGKPTKKQAENAEVKDAILSKLSSTEGKRCGDIAAELGITGQKCSALLSQLVKTGEVVKTEEKRVAFFTLPIGG